MVILILVGCKEEAQVTFLSAKPDPSLNEGLECTSGFVTSNLISRYDFTEGTGSVIEDLGSNGLDGMLNGGSFWSTGKFGNGISYNGSGYTSVTHHNNLIPNYMTLEAWVYPTSIDDHHIILAKYRGLADGYQLWIKPDGHISVAMNSGGGEDSVGIIPLNTWTHIVVTYGASDKKIYINGTLDSTHSSLGALSGNSEDFYIGQRGNNYYFKGKIDQVKLYSRELSAVEVLTNYEACN